ncbi:hypothetical protein BD289DRAFT_456899 [Coniella lustricola]|uniref:Rhodopsin domain-containing protein n=1 Tax=Coniella lustricola TaxID=2025994 RepID=A0A2T2ZU28_9PEZI|nr:hypothetical protein BD289DRAFT_456899 [Coniella lustricola]
MQDRGPQLQAVAILFLLMAIVSYALRTFVRLFMTRSFGMDDWLMTAATTTFVLYVTCVLGGVRYGTGQHQEDLTSDEEAHAKEFWFFCYLGYCWTMIFSKISIGLFLLRILIHKGSRMLVYLAMCLSVVTGLIFFFVALLQCSPIPYFWDKTIGGHCISIEVIIDLTFLYSSLNIMCDFTFALMPIFIVRNLNMPRRLKMATIPLLSLGCVASSGAVVRMAYVESFRDPDFLYSTVDIAIWATVEAGLAITAGSLACVRPLFKLAMQRFGFTSSKDAYPVDSSNTTALRLGSSQRRQHHYNHSTSESRTGGGGGHRSRGIDVFTLHTIHSSPADEESLHGSSLEDRISNDDDDDGSPITKMRAVASSEEKGQSLSRPAHIASHAMGLNPGGGGNNNNHIWGTKTHIYAKDSSKSLNSSRSLNYGTKRGTGGWPASRDYSPPR